MLTTLTDEQESLRVAARAIAHQARVNRTEDLSLIDRDKVWRLLADADLLGLRLRNGGIPVASGVEVAIVAEALGASLVPAPYLGSAVMAVELLELAGDRTERASAIASGDRRVGLLVDERLTGTCTRSTELPANLVWDGDGVATAVGIVLSDEIEVVEVPVPDSAGDRPNADLTRVVRQLETSTLKEADPIGRLSAPQFDRWLALTLIGLSADIAGVIRNVFELGIAYSRERIAYGAPIGSYQAIQHLCADSDVVVETAFEHVKYAAWAVDELKPSDALLAARTTKAYCSEAARTIPENMMQLFGGIGHTWEHVAHLHLRRGLLDRQMFGDEGVQLALIADSLLGTV